VGAAERLTVGLVAFALPTWLALQDGGYGVFERQQAGLVVWWLCALLLAFGILPRARPAREARIAALGGAALIAVTAIGLIATESTGRTSVEIARVVAYAGVLTVIWLGVGPGTWRSAAAGLGAAALLIPALAIVSRLDPSVAGDPELTGGRLAYPLGYWNGLAAWSAAAFAVGIAASAHQRRAGLRALGLAALPVAGLALHLTYSRGGLAALVVGIAVVVAASPNRVTACAHAAVGLAGSALAVLIVRSQPEIANGTGTDGAWIVAVALTAICVACAGAAGVTRRFGLDGRSFRVPRGRAAALAGVCVALALAGGIVAATASRDSTELATVPDSELSGDPAARLLTLDGDRGDLWVSALAAFADDPFTGTGAGTFQFWWDRDGGRVVEVRDAHSLYLESLAELGLPGLIALAVLLAGLLLGAVRARRALERTSDLGASAGLLAVAAVFCFAATFDWHWESSALVVLGLGGAAVAAGAAAVRVRPGSRLAPRRLALIALAVIAGAVQVPGIVAANRSQAAEAAFAAGLRDHAVELAGDAVQAEPWAAEPRALRGYLLLAQDDTAAARDDALDAVHLEPTNWRHRLLLARVEVAAGDYAAARAALEQLARLRPGAAVDPGAALRAMRSAGG
jgi:hypothetical protein